MKTTTVIHHSADFDGLFCREIARRFLPDAELIGWDFADAPLAAARLTTGDLIYVMDLPIDRVFGIAADSPAMDRITGNLRDPSNSRVIWIDHHKTSIETHPNEIPGYRLDGVAACRLAWQWFCITADRGPGFNLSQLPSKQQFIDRQVTEPLAVRLAGEYDIWDKRDERAEIFQFGLRSRGLNGEAWEDLLSMDTELTYRLLNVGRTLQEYQQRQDAELVNYRGFMVKWEGLKFLALNTGRFNSLTFAAKDVPETGHDALLGFRWDGKQWSVSLYHARHRMDLDLSAIAKKHGGGGHKGACGFVAKRLPWL